MADNDELAAAAAVSRLPPQLPELETVARAFIQYYADRDDHGGGCSNCGGTPHARTCFVHRFELALAARLPRPPAQLEEQSMAMDLAAERDLTRLFERDEVREALAGHCASTHDAADLEDCPYCLQLLTRIALATTEWLAMVDQDRARRSTGPRPPAPQLTVVVKFDLPHLPYPQNHANLNTRSSRGTINTTRTSAVM